MLLFLDMIQGIITGIGSTIFRERWEKQQIIPKEA
jgi:hypothetical protein